MIELLWVLICMVHLNVSSYHVTYTFQSESTLYSSLNVKELFDRNRRSIWGLIDYNGIRTHNHLESTTTRIPSLLIDLLTNLVVTSKKNWSSQKSRGHDVTCHFKYLIHVSFSWYTCWSTWYQHFQKLIYKSCDYLKFTWLWRHQYLCNISISLVLAPFCLHDSTLDE